MAGKITVSIEENVTQTLKSLRDPLKAFRTDINNTIGTVNALRESLNRLENRQDAATKKLSKASTGLADANNRILEQARQMTDLDFDKTIKGLEATTQASKESTKALQEQGDVESKKQNRADGNEPEKEKKLTAGKFISEFAGSELGQLTGDVIGQYLDLNFGASGSDGAGSVTNIVSGSLSGAASGAALGSMIPGIGTAVGGAIGLVLGGVLGSIQGALEKQAKENDAFTEYCNSLFDEIQKERQENISAGSRIAAGRESTAASLIPWLGSMDAAKGLTGEINELAMAGRHSFDELAGISKTLLKGGFQQEELIPALNRLSDAAAALGLSTEEMNTVAATLDSVRQGGQAGIDGLDALEAMQIPVYKYLGGISREQLEADMAEGKTTGDTIVQTIIKGMAGTRASGGFAGAAAELPDTFASLSDSVDKWQKELDNAMGEGYNSELMIGEGGLQDQIDFSAEEGQAMLGTYNAIGRHEARQEKLKVQYEQEAFSALTGGEISSLFQTDANEENRKKLEEMQPEYAAANKEYETAISARDAALAAGDSEGAKAADALAKTAEAKLDSLTAETKALSQNAYHADNEARTEMERQITLLEDIKQATVATAEYWNNGLQMEEETRTGVAAAKERNSVDQMQAEGPHEAFQRSNGLYYDVTAPSMEVPLDEPGYTFYPLEGDPFVNSAFGLRYVPRDNYLINAHQGERLLTANEARQYQTGSGVQVTVTGNEFTVREDADIYKIASEIAQRFRMQAMVS